MALTSKRHEPAWAVGNGRGMEMRQGAIRVFWEGMRIVQVLSGSAPEQAARTT